MKSRTIDLGGPVHYLDFGGEGPPMVLVHGIGGSSLNWLTVGPALAEHARVLAIDLAGFGPTPLAGRRADVRANRDLLDRFIEAVAGGTAILVGNSMGGLVSLFEAAARPDRVDALVLVDPALPREPGVRLDPLLVATFTAYAAPGIGERFMDWGLHRLGPERLVRRTMALCTVDPSRIPHAVIEAHVRLARKRLEEMPWATTAFLQAARSLIVVLARRERFHEIVAHVGAPTLIVHGVRDRLVPASAARAVAGLRPDWTLDLVEDAGHTPQLELPGRFVASVSGWMRDAGLTAPQERLSPNQAEGSDGTSRG